MIYNACLRFWRIAVFTPLGYLLICLAVEKWVFSERETSGFWDLKESTFSQVWIALFLVCVLMIPLVYALKNYWWASQRILEKRRTWEAIRNSLINRYLALLVICDTIALVGCVLFLMQGELIMNLYFGGCSLVAYAAAHPNRLAIDKIYTDEESDDAGPIE